MKRRRRLFLIGAVILVVACCFVPWLVFKYIICDGTQALQDMDAILQDARKIPDGAPSGNVRQQALLTADSSIWRNLQQWLTEAPGQYRLVLIDLEIPITPGDDASVGVQLSNGKAIVCSFYNGTLESCDEVEKILWPQERAAEDLKTILNTAREHPTGEPPRGLWWTGWFNDRGSPHTWENLQQWMVNAAGDFRVEAPPYEEHQCGYVSYTVKAHLSNGKTITCEFEGREIRSCEEAK